MAKAPCLPYIEKVMNMRMMMSLGWMIFEAFSMFFFKYVLSKKIPQIEERQAQMGEKLKPQMEAALIVCTTILAGICGWISYDNLNSWLDILKLMITYAGISMAAIIDYKVQLIPNFLIGIMALFRLVIFIFEFIFSREVVVELMLNSMISAVFVFAILFILSCISRNGFGMGDVKLLTVLGFLCGAYAVLNTLIGALSICVLSAMWLILTKKKKAKDKLAFGPFIFLGFIIAIFLGAY